MYMSWMFDGVILSVSNYDALLVGWSTQTLQPNITFSGGGEVLGLPDIPSADGAASSKKYVDDQVSAVVLPNSWNRLGNWNADTNTPTLSDGSGTDGDLYIVSVTY